jgi:hypothetical protein
MYAALIKILSEANDGAVVSIQTITCLDTTQVVVYRVTPRGAKDARTMRYAIMDYTGHVAIDGYLEKIQ